MAVDGHIGDEGEQARRPVAPQRHIKELAVIVYEAGVVVGGAELGVPDEGLQEQEIGRHPANPELAQRARHPPDSLPLGRSPSGDLLQKRVVVAGDDGSGIGRPPVQPDAEAGRTPVSGDAPVVRHEAVERILGRDAALNGVAVEPDALLPRHPGLARLADAPTGSDTDLCLDDVHPRHLLGDGVLHLNARVDLYEVEGAALGVLQKLGGGGVVQPGVAGELEGEVADLLPRLAAEVGCGRALHDFLVAPLHGAVALVEMDEPAVAVAQKLHLHMARTSNEPLKIDAAFAESRLRLAPPGGDLRLQLL